MSCESLKIKAERAVFNHLKGCFNFRCYMGHESNEGIDLDQEDPTVPILVVHAIDRTPFEGMPPEETGCWLISMSINLSWPAEMGEVQLAETLQSIDAKMDIEELQSNLNQPSGSDSRPVRGFHVYDTFHENWVDSRGNEFIEEQMSTGLLCGEHNAQG